MKAERIILRGLQLGLAFLTALMPAQAETTEPSNVPPEICDLVVTADRGTGDVVVNWSGGTPPFVVVRSNADDLRLAQRLEVVTASSRSRRVVDHDVLASGRRLFYQVYDHNSQPQVFGFSPDGGLPGAEIRVRGVGFPSDCGKIKVMAGGVDVPEKLDCGFLGFTFRVPVNGMTGYLLVATPAGATVAGAQSEPTCNGKPRRARSW